MNNIDLCKIANTSDERTVSYMSERAIPELKEALREWLDIASIEGISADLKEDALSAANEIETAIKRWQERLNKS